MIRVLHFVTGGGSGATKVALELACGNLRNGRYEPLLVFRRKRVPLPSALQAQVEASGLRVAWVCRSPKSATLRELAKLIADFRPTIFIAHGNSEHIWGRQAAFATNVPVVVHVEQNCERYPFWRLWVARPLAARTSATVCVSAGVAAHVRQLRLASSHVEVIHNGVEAVRFSVGAPPFATRSNDIIMVARFARQKDQPTLIRAARRLADSGWTGRLLLGGGGKESHRRHCERLAHRLGLRDRVDFLGQVSDAAPLYHRCKAAVLATHYEGLPLVLIDYMAAGCAAISSIAPGTTDVIQSGVNGWLFPAGDDAALASTLATVLSGGAEIERIVAHGQMDAPVRFSLSKMVTEYEQLFDRLVASLVPTLAS